MAAKKPKEEVGFRTIEVKNKDGSYTPVPVDETGNRVANQILASKMRNLIEDSIKKYKDHDTTLTPKELKELTDAAKNVAEFSGDVYRAAEPIAPSGPTPVSTEVIEGIDFGGLKKEEPKPENEDTGSERDKQSSG